MKTIEEIRYRKLKRIITKKDSVKENIYDDIVLRVGDGMTMQVGSDCYPYTITKIISPKKIEIQEDNTEPDHARGFNYYSNQVYIYTPNPNGRKKVISLRKRLVWKQVNTNYPYFYPGRYFYQDPSF